ncbi:L-serine dehydratase [Chitinophaga costaii]|uniref:L-serine ammonia-lyase n=1 Tax=Chitinophaga costaii TaxID=1335309 RepID=A0A1C3YRS3_9BACT|nr:L-serine ammonia-lyase, iron-sulfur-dependent, subunit alpha [Chitinophaga costaii]PUZ30077.1 serine dehydratase [Chitinophaga costaii]SCB72797.1 L-serine dehydratase [Chitinophaga costaii]
MANYPSIFNDVIGPVMRGPSSSHCAAALRIGRICRDLMQGNIQQVHIVFDPDGSLATTHKTQGSDMGLFGGLLGWEADDERLPASEEYLSQAGIITDIDIRATGATHPNTYTLCLSNAVESKTLTGISTGGGMITIIEIDGAQVNMEGDFFVTLVYCHAKEDLSSVQQQAFAIMPAAEEIIAHPGSVPFLEISSQALPDAATIAALQEMPAVAYIRQLLPVLPVLSRKNVTVPFISAAAMQAYNADKNKALWELAVEYECERGLLSKAEVLGKMQRIVRIMQNAIYLGLKGTKYKDRLLGSQSVNFKKQFDSNKLIEGQVNNRVIMYVSAMMEVKSSMGVIVAAPTAGSCGALPGALIGMADALELPEEVLVQAMLAAGIIGVFISAHATFAAEVGGCQAECGSGASMAAAALVYMAGGSFAQSLSAASLALQNSLGMICDPIANRVEAPCLGKNVLAATNALSCANMALADYNHLIPLDEVIDAMDKVGHSMPHALRCTNLGGLSVTPTAQKLDEALNNANNQYVFKSC